MPCGGWEGESGIEGGRPIRMPLQLPRQREGKWLNWEGNSRDGETWRDSRGILKAEPLECSDGRYGLPDKKSQDDSDGLGLRIVLPKKTNSSVPSMKKQIKQ